MHADTFNRLTLRLGQGWWPARLLGLARLYGLCGLLSFPVAMAAPAPTAEEVLRLIGVPAEQSARLARGEIVTHEAREATDKELAMTTALYLAVPLDKVVDYFRRGNLAAIDPDITARGVIPANADISAFKGFAFSAKQSDEAADLLEAEAGDRFNLSAQEIQSFAALKDKLANADKKSLVEGVSQRYREILLQRWQAYRKGGLAGIAPYARDGGTVDPGAELKIAAENSKTLARYFPALYQGWLNYPNGLPAGTEEQFYWLNRKVENRPTAILAHRVLQAGETGAVIVARQFYAGHSYNADHLVVGALPYRDGTVVFYGQRSSTDQVAGVASGVRHNIGRGQLKDQMVKRLEKLRGILKAGTSTK
ncbi:hypothetical protein [Methylococcus sp. EFPC2]|uniref:hypothetical protein n=1 Tax=Methylococcus sp. EFPC2 TaxID=2812648 RepID=UPI0019683DBF|nr:hypothetical protein [Methylococcus sp. EFPC2]QSA97831.1 hypothetical protein JWZ97_03115 [Methylococcus sp. EFPC2]